MHLRFPLLSCRSYSRRSSRRWLIAQATFTLCDLWSKAGFRAQEKLERIFVRPKTAMLRAQYGEELCAQNDRISCYDRRLHHPALSTELNL